MRRPRLGTVRKVGSSLNIPVNRGIARCTVHCEPRTTDSKRSDTSDKAQGLIGDPARGGTALRAARDHRSLPWITVEMWWLFAKALVNLGVLGVLVVKFL